MVAADVRQALELVVAEVRGLLGHVGMLVVRKLRLSSLRGETMRLCALCDALGTQP